jgi:hypothetical protein
MAGSPGWVFVFGAFSSTRPPSLVEDILAPFAFSTKRLQFWRVWKVEG